MEPCSMARKLLTGNRRYFTLVPLAIGAIVALRAFFPIIGNAASTGLVAAYSFDEGSGTVVNDSSGNSNNGTISGASWVTAGKFGGALSFNGSNSRVIVNDSASLDLTNGMTLEAWVKPSVAPSGWRDVIYKANDIYFLEAGSGDSVLHATPLIPLAHSRKKIVARVIPCVELSVL